jgi:phosphonate transport system substrate-binding protein
MDDRRIPGRMTRRLFSGLLAGTAASLSWGRAGWSQGGSRIMHVAISAETLAGANVNDARAAYKVWSKQVASSLGNSTAELVPDVFIPTDQMVQMVRQGSVDMFGITAWEYAKLQDFVDPSTILLDESFVNGLEYVLLVHNAGPCKKLSDLRGRQLAVYHHRDMTLFPAWMGNLLAAENLPRMEAFFCQQIVRESLTQTVLPVFFRRMDAAVVIKSSFATAVELNPQLGRELRVLATSPPVIPIILCFRKNASPEGKRELIANINRTQSLPAGQQIEALYQFKRLVMLPSNCMNATMEMLRQYERNMSRSPGARKDHS